MKNSVVHVRVNDQLKNNVERILEELGLSLSFVINMYFRQIEAIRGISFDDVSKVKKK